MREAAAGRTPEQTRAWLHRVATNWSAIAGPANGDRWFDVTAAGEGFVAVGRTADGEQPMVTAWSRDGLRWQTDVDGGGRVLRSVVAVDGTLVGVGSGILTSRVCPAP